MVSQSDADTSGHTTGRMSSSKARVQIVGRVSGRRNWTVEQKLAIIGEAFASGSSVANTIERHEISSGRFIHGAGNCLTVNLPEFATAIWISKRTGICAGRTCATVRNACAATILGSVIVGSLHRRVRESDDRCGVIEIELRSGVRVRVHEGVGSALLTSVLDALGAR